MNEKNNQTPVFFQNGARFVRADFHLHTMADKEFAYADDKSRFVDAYIAKLADQDIHVGVITNHNKFDFEEFKHLSSKASKREILLLPGVELSVGEGAAGVHTLIVFDTSWLDRGDDRINRFIDSQFPGRDKAEYQLGNARSGFGLIDTVKALDKYGLPYFLVFAHVEASNGLWTEMFTRLDDMLNSDWTPVLERTLGFQKVRTFDKAESGRPDRAKVLAKLGDRYPVDVEGSDPKSLEEIGKGRSCYIKVGDFSFDAVRFALESRDLRVSAAIEDVNHSWIKSISFYGGVLDGRKIDFSPELNSIIGVRGSGKSSIIESIRFALQIPTGGSVVDEKYKNGLVAHTLESGGKVEVEAIDSYGQSFVVSRIFGNRPEVYRNGERQPTGISIGEVVVRKPLCFGQKELSAREDTSENDLVERLIGSRLSEIRRTIEDKKTQIRAFWSPALAPISLDDKIGETESMVKTLETQLAIYKTHGVEEKLKEKAGLTQDHVRLEAADRTVSSFAKDMKDVLARYLDELQEIVRYAPKGNLDFWVDYRTAYDKVLAIISGINSDVEALTNACSTMRKFITDHEAIVDSKKESFAAIERELASKLAESGYANVRPDDYVRLQKKLELEKQTLLELSRKKEGLGRKQEELRKQLAELTELYRDEYALAKKEIDAICKESPLLKIEYEFRGDKSGFKTRIADAFRGSGIKGVVYDKIVGSYPDFIQIYLARGELRDVIGEKCDVFLNMMESQLLDLLLWQTPNKATITLRGKALSSHSLGQRAAALIMFVMGLKENDVVIIDQPEDDLDSQTIYEDVIKLVVKLKPHVQFVFATHNANIPVLGDAEQIIVCKSDEMGAMDVRCGALDVKEQQDNIVGIMEGGNEAFGRRKEIYRLWKEAK